MQRRGRGNDLVTVQDVRPKSKTTLMGCVLRAILSGHPVDKVSIALHPHFADLNHRFQVRALGDVFHDCLRVRVEACLLQPVAHPVFCDAGSRTQQLPAR